jgi:hypothetical protein
MPIFEPVILAIWTPTYLSTGSCSDDHPTTGNALTTITDCENHDFQWTPDIQWDKTSKNRTINLEMVSSFEEGVHQFDDPTGSTYAAGDPDPAQTLITMSNSPASIMIDEALTTFRTRMAKLF